MLAGGRHRSGTAGRTAGRRASARNAQRSRRVDQNRRRDAGDARARFRRSAVKRRGAFSQRRYRRGRELDARRRATTTREMGAMQLSIVSETVSQIARAMAETSRQRASARRRRRSGRTLHATRRICRRRRSLHTKARCKSARDLIPPVAVDFAASRCWLDLGACAGMPRLRPRRAPAPRCRSGRSARPRRSPSPSRAMSPTPVRAANPGKQSGSACTTCRCRSARCSARPRCTLRDVVDAAIGKRVRTRQTSRPIRSICT